MVGMVARLLLKTDMDIMPRVEAATLTMPHGRGEEGDGNDQLQHCCGYIYQKKYLRLSLEISM
jgi:hypothetical protein